MKKTVRLHLPLFLYILLIFILSSLSNLDVPDLGFDMGDKVYHLFEYIIFGFLLMRSGYDFKDRIKYPVFLIVLLAGALFAASDEIHQYFVPGRECDVLDFAVDVVGIILGQTIDWVALRNSRKRIQSDNSTH